MSATAPRSVDAYLAALRAELAGEDPALVQDALYDAEEHLRAEVAANPAMAEDDVLERVMTTYGRPEEIAAAYRDTETKVARALEPPASTRPSSSNPLVRFFSVYSDSRAYTSLFYMFLSMPTGILYFTFAITGISLSFGLAILIFGFPLFLAFISVARAIALGEGRLLEAVSGERMPRRPVHPGPRAGFWARIGAMLRDSRTWTTLVYLVLMLPVGILYFTGVVTGLALGLSMLLVPVVGVSQRWHLWLPWAPHQIEFTPAWLDTPVGWVFDVILGAVLLTTLLHVARAVIALHARTAKALLVT